MPPWVVAGVILVSAVAFLFTYNRINYQHNENCPSGSGGCSYHDDRSNQDGNHDGTSSSERHERYDTPPDLWQRRHVEDDDCPICLENIYLRPQRTLPCHHRLHSECFRQLRSQSAVCPICRRQI